MRFRSLSVRKAPNRKRQYALVQKPVENSFSKAIQNLQVLQETYHDIWIGKKDASQDSSRSKEQMYIYTCLRQNFESIYKSLTLNLHNRNSHSVHSIDKTSDHSLHHCLYTSAEKITALLEQMYFWSKHITRVQASRGHILNRAHLHSAVFAYSELFYSGKSQRKTDLHFLAMLVRIDRRGIYTNFMRQLLTVCAFETTIPERSESKKNSVSPHCNGALIKPNLRKDLTASEISAMLQITAGNRFLFDQRLNVLLCTVLEENMSFIRGLYFNKKNLRVEKHRLMTAQQAHMCISALNTMHVHHKVINSILMYMVQLPSQHCELEQSKNQPNLNQDVNALIKALWLVCQSVDIISEADFTQYVRYIFLNKDSISAEGASYLIAVMAKREIQCVYSPKLDEKEHVADDTEYSSLPRFHLPQNTKVGPSYSFQSDGSNIITNALQIIDSILIERISAMAIYDICRVVRALNSDFVGVGSETVWKLLLSRIDSLYPKKTLQLSAPAAQSVEMSLPQNSLSLIKVNSRRSSAKAYISKPLAEAHATLLALLPKIETRLHTLSDEDEPSVEIDSTLLNRIAGRIPLTIFQRYPKRYADVSMVLRRAFTDFPHLYDISPNLWDAVKSAKIKDPQKGKRKLYNTTLTLKSCAKDIFKKTAVSSEAIDSRARFKATRERVRKKSFFDKYRKRHPTSTVNRFL